MSVQPIRVVPRDQRLRVTAKYSHETLQYQGDIFSFLEYLMSSKLNGVGTFRVRSDGEVYGLEFDVRKLVPADDSEIAIDAKPTSMP